MTILSVLLVGRVVEMHLVDRLAGPPLNRDTSAVLLFLPHGLVAAVVATVENARQDGKKQVKTLAGRVAK